MSKASQHTALARQWEILKHLPTRAPGITAGRLATRLANDGYQVTKRTIERDLVQLSALFGIVANDKGKPFGWYWMRGESGDLPGISLADCVSTRLMEDFLRPLLPAAVVLSLEDRFRHARTKLESLAATSPTARWPEKVRFLPANPPLLPPTIDPAVLCDVQEALVKGRQIQVDYRGHDTTDPRPMTLHPMALIQRGQVTYLVARAWQYDDIRLYTVHRIVAARITDEPANLPSDFDLDAYIENGAMNFGQGESFVLRMSVDESLERILHETKLSEDQTIEDGIVTATVQDSWQLEWWIHSQGGAITVLEPQAYRERIIAGLKTALKGYGVEH